MKSGLGLAALLLVTAVPGCGTVPRRDNQSPPQARNAGDATPKPSSYRYFLYAVQRGDSLYSLGRRFNVPWQEIMRANSVKPDDLVVGSYLYVPLAEGTAPPRLTRPEPASNTGGRPISSLDNGQPGARFCWPARGRLVRRYGDKLRGLPEPGLGIAARAGEEVRAVADGKVHTVVSAGSANGSAWGNVVAIAHAGGLVSWYARIDGIRVREGQRVSKGQPIGALGRTGTGPARRSFSEDGPVLAFRLYSNERPIDPEDYLP